MKSRATCTFLGGATMQTRYVPFAFCLFALIFVSISATRSASARPPIRKAFFERYPNSGHCGVCHFDFNGGGPRNPYGLQIQVGINNGLSYADAIAAAEPYDSDSDGYTNLTEITSTLFTNTPTFPGLSSTNATSTLNIPLSEIEPYLTPMGAIDMTPPTVVVLSPNGGGSYAANSIITVNYTATDSSGISHVDIYFSDDSGASFKPVGKTMPPTGSFSWFVPNLPTTQGRIEVEAYDNAGNEGDDESDADFTVTAAPGLVPTTLRDMEMPGTQPFEGAILDDPSSTCRTCHGDYDDSVESWFNWRGSMMGQTARDPFFYACLAVANQDAPSSGDLCIRCHSPGGWQEGRSVDTDGGLLNSKDRWGVQCDFCHRMVDRNYVAGVSPDQDVAVLDAISPLPLQYGNAQFINDPAPLKRGPYADAQAAHEFVQSPFHLSGHLCGTCHDVSNPVFVRNDTLDYSPGTLDQPHRDFDLRDMAPVERTFSEWSNSTYATTGVYAPQFAGDKADGIVSTCEDCHMRDVTGRGCNISGSPNRTDLGLHDFTGGNTFVPDILPDFYPGVVDPTALQAGKARVIHMLQLAATLGVTPDSAGIVVRVTNETGHRLPSGYPEGRRMWLQVEALDTGGQTVYESGAYDFGTAVLTHDPDLKIYEIHGGLSPSLAGALGFPAGPSFHFVLNDTVYFDDRIPPRGFTNAAFKAIQSPPVDYSYADGQYWDDTRYDNIPANAESVRVTLYYQTTSKEYVEFLRDANVTNNAGLDLYNAWVNQGMAPPVAMADTTVGVNITVTGVPEQPVTEPRILALAQNTPNPFSGRTTVAFTLPEPATVRVEVYDLAGRRVNTLAEGNWSAGLHTLTWDGRDDRGQSLASGIYFIRLHSGRTELVRRAVLVD
jgi:hypothetical protein